MMTKRLSWGTGLVIAIAVFLVGIAILVTIAVRQDISLVQDRYYERGQEYGSRQRAIERALALSESLTLEVRRKVASVQFPRTVPAGEIHGTITLYRPSNRSLDRSMVIALDTAWSQTVDCTGVAPGFWRIQVEWTMNREEYFREFPVVIPE